MHVNGIERLLPNAQTSLGTNELIMKMKPINRMTQRQGPLLMIRAWTGMKEFILEKSPMNIMIVGSLGRVQPSINITEFTLEKKPT